MALSLYNKKRDFSKTEEPAGKKKSSKGHLRFVVQKHDASHLHYDFRLEMEGLLKSWAVPKGPSLNPADKRLAMAVEDHPFDYRDFEGVIPEGSYGGGTVIVWDEGTYSPMGGEGLSRKEQEKMLLQQLHNGDLKLNLNGEKLKGTYALFHMKSRGANTWLLVKKKDEYSTTDDVRLQDASVKTGKTLSDVAAENGTVVKHPDADVAVKPRSGKKAAAEKTKSISKQNTVPSPGVKASMPDKIIPMMAVLADEPFDNDDWIYEIKWDGYRAVAHCNGNNVQILSRNLKAFTGTYAPVAAALKRLKLKAVVDGEIVAVNDKGIPDFQLMQNYQNTPADLQYYLFDILWLNGKDLTGLPLLERKEILKSIIPEDDDVVRYSDHIVGKGKAFFNLAVDKGLEGIMAKKAASKYLVGKRNDSWLKVKVTKRQEVVIGGFTSPRNSREYFGALLLGVYDNGKLKYVGHTGSGFNSSSLKSVYDQLAKLVTGKCPFAEKPKTNQPATWVKPDMVCEIKLSEWTKEGIARHPIFIGLRTDKKAKEVVLEREKHVENLDEKKPSARNRKPPLKSASTVRRKANKQVKTSGMQLDLNAGNEQTITLNKQSLKLTNLDKLYWKKEKFTKGDMLNYYLRMAPFMLPYMKDHPVSLNRHPNGIAGKSFYQKDVKGKVAEWIQTHPEFSESTGETVNYFVCKDEAHLIYMANLGCIEMNPWHSRAASPDKPDWCLIDLDPDDSNTFEQVMDAAHVINDILKSIGVEGYPKTSGSTGIHILVPLGAKYSYEQSKQLAELVVNLAHHELLSTTSLERSPAKRKGKIYLDYLQNRYGQTMASVYSLRPKPGVPVSTPLFWEEIKKGLTPTTFSAYNIFDRLDEVGDIYTPVLGKGIDIKKVLAALQSMFS